jgi:hypothetical protein
MKYIKKKYALFNPTNFENGIVDNIKAVDNIDCPTNEISFQYQNASSTTSIQNPLHFIISLERQIDDLGYYTSSGDTESINIYESSPIQITGETSSKLDRIRTYQNKFKLNLNLADDLNDEFVGLIDETDEYYEYVIGGDLDQTGQYINGTGIIYKTYKSDNRTEFTYLLSNFDSNTLSYELIYKDENTIDEIRDLILENDLFIERGNAVAPNFRHSLFAEISSVNDVENSPFYTTY